MDPVIRQGPERIDASTLQGFHRPSPSRWLGSNSLLQGTRMSLVARSCRPALLAVLILAGCGHHPGEAAAPTPVTSASSPVASSTVKTPIDVVAANVDATVDPGVDFFSYANGAWLKQHPIPKSEAAYGIGTEVDDEVYAQLRDINEKAAKTTADAGSDEQRVGDFWTAAMDQARADSEGLKPLASELAQIDAVHDVPSALDAAFALQPLGVDVLFAFGVGQDEKQSEAMAVHLGQGGLGLPERDYYFNTEAGVAKAREAYVAHLAHVLQLTGVDAQAAQTRAKAVMAFETTLAKASRKIEDLRDPQHNYNKLKPAELIARYTPSIDWSKRFQAWKIQPAEVIVGQPEFFTSLDKTLKQTSPAVLRDYLRLHLIDAYASFLSNTYDQEHFAFYGQVLSGAKEQRPRWKRVLSAEDSAIGMVLGRMFVDHYFPERSKLRYEALVEEVRTSYGARIDRLDWMSAPTRAKAREKLAAMHKKVGYPDKWKDYSGLQIGRDSYAANMLSAARWHFADDLAKLDKPVDHSEWGMTPQTYNAYYDPSDNEIVLPAAQFTVPGFKDDQLDDAIIYGYAAGSTIGHEMTHGFDDQGRQFDAKGNLADWWTAEDAEHFKQRADVMVKQFDAYEPLPGLHVNGRASLGENIADYGGILIALDAFKKTDQYKQGKKIAGYTPLQRFFLGYALSWLYEAREESQRQHLLSDVHAPPKWRVNGPLSNIPDFYEAFGIKPGQPMWRAEKDRVQIW